MISQAELRGLLQSGESDRVERKASASDFGAIRQLICAFANDLPGHEQPGVLIVGVNDDGSCAGLTVDDSLQTRFAEIHSDGKILPFPSMTIQKMNLDGCELLVVEVQPSSLPPVRCDGRVWVRVGPTLRQATADDERILSEKQLARNLPFDQSPVAGSAVDDLDMDLFERVYLPSAVPPDVLAANERSTIDQLRSLHLITGAKIPNVAGILALGKDPRAWIPGAYIQFVRFDGESLTDPIRHQHELNGPFPELLRALDDLFEANISVATDVRSAPLEIRRPDYPLVALQQIARNAVMHRNYQTSNAPIRIHWFSDRVEVHSPGGPFGQVTAENFGEPGATDYRNPTIAEVMKNLGYVQRFGIGLALARRELKTNANPELRTRITQQAVLITLPRRP